MNERAHEEAEINSSYQIGQFVSAGDYHAFIYYCSSVHRFSFYYRAASGA